ncbi:hypothetical protein AVEN_226647-1 [Araneus ventricosus]|uniref:RNase H type-1 domain-containing protein n=1 Tax=Araneus ventricosus TaxID=182803 RepID=A0A4Y2TMU5_ARAVE|nr:hypothetical protein AVEN_226647-1 [Araneus ventricosus]
MTSQNRTCCKLTCYLGQLLRLAWGLCQRIEYSNLPALSASVPNSAGIDFSNALNLCKAYPQTPVNMGNHIKHFYVDVFFTAEIAAVSLALEKISDCLERKFIIYMDSLSVIESLKSFCIHSHYHPLVLVLNVLHLLNKLASRDFNILLCWVPSHVGIVGNEEADKATKLASTQTKSTVPLTDFKKYTKVVFYLKWQRQWDTENKLHAVKPHVQLWPSLMNRKADTLLTRPRVGHTRYTYRHQLFGEQAPMCSKCNCRSILTTPNNFKSEKRHSKFKLYSSVQAILRVDSIQRVLRLLKYPGKQHVTTKVVKKRPGYTEMYLVAQGSASEFFPIRVKRSVPESPHRPLITSFST